MYVRQTITKHPIVARLTHHLCRNDIKHLLITAAAAGGAVGDRLNLLEGFKNVVELLLRVERCYDIVVLNLLAVANDYVFHIILQN